MLCREREVGVWSRQEVLSPGISICIVSWRWDWGAGRGCCTACAAPPLVAFAGKRQWMELLNVDRRGRDKVTRLAIGPQSMRPQVTRPPSQGPPFFQMFEGMGFLTFFSLFLNTNYIFLIAN